MSGQTALSEGVVRNVGLHKTFHCAVCQSPLAGEESVKQHLQGSKHREAGARYAIININNNPPRSLLDLLLRATQDAAKTGVIKNISGTTNMTCTICNIQLSGTRPVEDHLAGDDHRKKKIAQQIYDEPSQSLPFGMSRGPDMQGLAPITTPYAMNARTSLENPVMSRGPDMQGPAPITTPYTMNARTSLENPVMSRGPDMQGPAPITTPYAMNARTSLENPVMSRGPDMQGPAPITTPYTMNARTSLENPVMSRGPDMQGPAPITTPYTMNARTSLENPVMSRGPDMQGPAPITTPAVEPPSVKARAPEQAMMVNNPTWDDASSLAMANLVSSLSALATRYPAQVTQQTTYQLQTPLFDGPELHHNPSPPQQQQPMQRNRGSISSSSSSVTSVGSGIECRSQTLVYRAQSQPRGHVYVFNYTFPGQRGRERQGACHDTTNLRSTFDNMGYEVFVCQDYSKTKTLNELIKIINDPRLGQVDALIIFFLSHGSDAYTFYSNDCEKLSLLDIRYLFTDSKCHYMKNKPKIFFTNYCRGQNMEKRETDALLDVPTFMATIHAAVEGVMAIRNLGNGTYFVKCLCEVLREHAADHDLRRLYSRLYEKMDQENSTKPMWEDYGFLTEFYF
ncbi:caspase-2-like 1 [Homarus americanus]|uniref:Caspase-2-like 1 n=1 Tax=Homarus americanus TaxID=6706 RepID=A0A8J5JR02_HOMAM|nr:caspase-2-like 1 [Homarus americanus]